MPLRKLVFTLIIGLWTTIAAAQDNICPAIVDAALTATDEACQGIGRNQACYGSTNVTAQPQPDAGEFVFQRQGDVVDVAALRSLRMSPIDVDAGTWGVALLRVQANLPYTLPGQTVTVLLFGDTELTNAAQSAAEQRPPTFIPATVIEPRGVRVRQTPSTDAPVIGTMAYNYTTTLIGQLPDHSWLNVMLPSGKTGWISGGLLRSDGDTNTLNIVEPQTAVRAPMQAFYLTSGIGAVECAEVPTTGSLVQTPSSTAVTFGEKITLVINNVTIELQPNTTLFVDTDEDGEMQVAALEGSAEVSAGGETHIAVAGTEIIVLLNDDLTLAAAPSAPDSYDDPQLDLLPIEALDREIETAPPLPDEKLEVLLEYESIFGVVQASDHDALFDYLVANDECTANGTCETVLLDFMTDDLDYPTDEIFTDENAVRLLNELNVEGTPITVETFCLGCAETVYVESEPIEAEPADETVLATEEPLPTDSNSGGRTDENNIPSIGIEPIPYEEVPIECIQAPCRETSDQETETAKPSDANETGISGNDGG